jgi:hypothetical protein
VQVLPSSPSSPSVLVLDMLISQLPLVYRQSLPSVSLLFSLFLIPVTLLSDANVFSHVRHNLAVIGPDLRSSLV